MAGLAALAVLAGAGWLAWHGAHGAGSGERARADARPQDPAGGGGHGGKKLPLSGRTILIDPGHNPHNRDHPEEINKQVSIGAGKKECDTVGASTASGYPEAEFTLDLAKRVRTALEKQGATVRLTHEGHTAYGPCVDERAEAGNKAKADAAVSLHADGAPEQAHGFHVIVPGRVHEGAADTRRITGPSHRLGSELLGAFRQSTGEPPARYIGDGKGMDVRKDLGGLNLSSVPKVFLECGNMRNAQDADRLEDAKWRAGAARGIGEGLAAYLTPGHGREP
ncbi:N-acetylmuramoyl-L-alanine amidase [Actinacidiphila sp. SB3-2]